MASKRTNMGNFKTRWTFISPYLQKYRIQVGVGILCVIISTALDQVSPWMIKSVIDRITCYQSFTANAGIAKGTCSSMQEGFSNSTIMLFSMPLYIWTPLLIILASTLVSGLLLYFQRWLVISASREFEYEFRNDLFNKLQKQSKSFMDKHKVGDLMSHATNDLERLRDFVGPVVLHIARMPFTLIFTLTAVFLLSPKLAFVGIIPVFILPLFVNRFLKKMYKFYGNIQKHLGGLNSFIQDAISGVQVIKAYAKETTFLDKFEKQSGDLKNTSIKVMLLTSAMWPLIGLFSSLGIIAAVWYGSILTQNNEITLGVLIAVLMYLIKLQFPLAGLGWIANLWQRSNASMDRMIELYDKFEKTEGSDYITPKLIHQQPFKNLELKGISFGYSDHALVLTNLDLSITSGQSLGIVGPTGAGKTTLMHLICGIYNPTSGNLKLNNRNWNEFESAEWKSYFSLTPQDGFLFSKTISDNIQLGRQNSTTLEVEKVGNYSGFSRDLGQIESGYQALLGERGINLSGGQRQRVGLARAMLHNSEILCLDDTLSALDSETEGYVIGQMQEQFIGKTTIIIAHRYSAIMNCNHIIYLEDGEIIEQGTHDDLIQLNQKYAKIYAKQKLSEELNRA